MSRTNHRVFQVSTPEEIKSELVTLHYSGKTTSKFKTALAKSEQQTSGLESLFCTKKSKDFIGGFMLTSLFTFLLICIRLCVKKGAC